MPSTKTGFQAVAVTLTVVAALVRLIPHPPNFAPLGATALFGGARLRGWQAYVVPLLAMLVTDPLRSWMEGGYPAYSWGTLAVYGSLLVSVFLGRAFLRDTNNPAKIGAVALAGSVQFFLITNFFVWLTAAGMYPRSVTGLMSCYAAAVPFFGYTVAADLLYCGVLFGAYAFLRRFTQEAQPTAAAA